MKKVLLILITLISVCAQGQTYKISQLAGTKWILCVGDTSRVKRVWEFSNKTLKTSTLFKSINRSHTFTYNYYLSISETEVFSTDLIGKGTTGGYIVLQKKDGIECMKIENLTDHTLKVVIEASKETNRTGNSSAIFILKRIR
jgi:hypothetical protein